jgi:DNA-binding phage protein
MKAKTTRFAAANYLDSGERQTAYVKVALESGDAVFIRDARRIVARARRLDAGTKKVSEKPQ